MKVKKSIPSRRDKELLKKIGSKLVRLRKGLGYSNSDDFAYDKEINRSQYGKYEAGSQDIRITTLARIVGAMGMTIEDFFRDGLDPK